MSEDKKDTGETILTPDESKEYKRRVESKGGKATIDKIITKLGGKAPKEVGETQKEPS